VIAPAVAACGLEAVRADHLSEPGLITAQVIQHLINDPLVIADLTGSNPNVFYELAIRHAIRKPLVQIIEKDEKIPFDVAGMRTVPVDHRDLDSVAVAKDEIEKQIRAVLGKKPGEIESPVSIGFDGQRGELEDRLIGSWRGTATWERSSSAGRAGTVHAVATISRAPFGLTMEGDATFDERPDAPVSFSIPNLFVTPTHLQYIAVLPISLGKSDLGAGDLRLSYSPDGTRVERLRGMWGIVGDDVTGSVDWVRQD